ncbi:MAG: hypothetical protein O3B01_29285 [Planctomycetota bacterium]|nr:hypothetical protein [Planctomycetota bacterium]MDA1142677.1 hypothetical protein [Planctomycetota bacterium]
MPAIRPLDDRVLAFHSGGLPPGLQENLRAFLSGEQLPSPSSSDVGRVKVKMPWDRGTLPETSAARQHASPVVRGWNPKEKEPILGTGSPGKPDITWPHVDVRI